MFVMRLLRILFSVSRHLDKGSERAVYMIMNGEHCKLGVQTREPDASSRDWSREDKQWADISQDADIG